MQKHLWLQVYLWVHLRAEEGEQDNFVPPSELVPLPTGHLEHLIPNHRPLDHYGGREAEGLAQDAVCGREGTSRGDGVSVSQITCTLGCNLERDRHL